MKKLILIILTGLLLQHTPAQKNSSIETLPANADSIEIVNSIHSILAKLNQRGFLTAEIDSISMHDDKTKIYYHKGEQIRWGKIEIKTENEDELKKIGVSFKSYTNKPLIINKLKHDIEKIIIAYENSGYPFIQVEFIPLSFLNNVLSARLEITEYNLYIIDSIIVKGTSKIEKEILKKIIDIKPGDIYNERKISKISTLIENSGFITEIKPNELEFTKNKTSVYTYTAKQKSNSIDGIIGFLPNNKADGKLLITGEINMSLLNSFNRAENIYFNWKKLESNTQSLNLGLVYPYIKFTDFGADFDFSVFKKDTSYINLKPVGGIRYQLGGGNYIRLFYQKSSSNVLNKSTETIINQYESSVANLFGAGFYYHNLDYKNNPRRGTELNAEFAIGNKKTLNNKDNNTRSEVTIDARFFYPLFKEFVFSYHNLTGIINDENQFENELFLIGGFKTLRGFDEKSISASLYTLSAFELRYLFEKNSNVYIFYDWCYYEKNTSIINLSDTPGSIGLGVSFYSRSGIFSVSYALGQQLNNPIELRSAKIHIGYINRF